MNRRIFRLGGRKCLLLKLAPSDSNKKPIASPYLIDESNQHKKEGVVFVPQKFTTKYNFAIKCNFYLSIPRGIDNRMKTPKRKHYDQHFGRFRKNNKCYPIHTTRTTKKSTKLL